MSLKECGSLTGDLSGVLPSARPCRRCAEVGLSCVPQVDKPGARACQPCFTSKQKCSWAEDGPTAPPPIVSVTAEAEVHPRGRARAAANDVQLRIANAAEESLLVHKRSAEALNRIASASERTALAMEGVMTSLQDITRSLAPPPVRTRRISPIRTEIRALPRNPPQGSARSTLSHGSGVGVSDRAPKRPRQMSPEVQEIGGETEDEQE